MSPEAPFPTFSFRDWLSGTRPVAGAAGACALMLLACSWFVLAPGDVGDTTDVGSPPAVHLQQARDAGRIVARRFVAPAPRRNVGSRRSVTPRQVPPRVLSRGTRNGRSAAPSAAAPSTSTSPAPAPATQPQAATPVPTPTLPAPVDEAPAVSLPLPEVSVPPLPSVTVPDVGTTTTPLGLP